MDVRKYSEYIDIGKKTTKLVRIPFEEDEIEYNDKKEGYRYIQEGGEDTLILKTDAGDVKVRTLGETDAVEL